MSNEVYIPSIEETSDFSSDELADITSGMLGSFNEYNVFEPNNSKGGGSTGNGGSCSGGSGGCNGGSCGGGGTGGGSGRG